MRARAFTASPGSQSTLPSSVGIGRDCIASAEDRRDFPSPRGKHFFGRADAVVLRFLEQRQPGKIRGREVKATQGRPRTAPGFTPDEAGNGANHRVTEAVDVEALDRALEAVVSPPEVADHRVAEARVVGRGEAGTRRLRL